MRKMVLSISRASDVWPSRNSVLVGVGRFAVSPATSVEGALRMLERWNYSIVVLGHSLSLAEKQEFIRKAREIKSLPILCLCAGGSDGCGATAEVDSLDGPDRLLRVIARICGS